MPDLTPAEIASRSFRLRMRGYDPDEVRSFLSDLASALSELAEEREQLRLQAGAPKNLGSEFEQIGREVTAVLEAARAAAESMRSRASADASRWRSEAVAEAESTRRQARSDAEHLRGDAWTTSAELLDQVQAEAARTRSQAEKEALRLVGEAELDTHRSQAHARREGEEIVRAAKMEAERMLVEARARHDQTVETAQRQAEAAQERARALEGRRQELGRELESLRDALSAAEIELDERREALNLSPPTVDEPEEPPSEWEGGETVRVVRSTPPSGSAEPKRVGGESIAPQPQVRVITASELARLSEPKEPAAAPPAMAQAAPPNEGVVLEPEPVEVSEPEIPDAPAADKPAVVDAPDEDHANAMSTAEPPSDRVGSGDEAGTASGDVDVVGAPEPVEQEEPIIPAPAPVEAPRADDLSGLFARLREPGDLEPPASPSEPAAAAAAAHAVDEASVAPAARRRTQTPPDHAEVRDRRLLPITNRSLRNLKRQLTDDANVALDELRSHEGTWAPDPAALAESIRADIVVLTAESFGAGHAAAEELLAERLTRPPTPKLESSGEFAEDLAEELEHILTESRATGAGPQQLGSAVSRVFRAWRTDESERRVRAMAISSYNQGLAASLVSAGRGIAVVVAGRGCATCRAAAEVGEPDLNRLPPYHPGCECLVVPS